MMLDDVVLVLQQFRISGLVLPDYSFSYLIQEGLLDAQQTSMTGSTAQQTAQYIASAFVLGHDAVADHEGGASGCGR